MIRIHVAAARQLLVAIAMVLPPALIAGSPVTAMQQQPAPAGPAAGATAPGAAQQPLVVRGQVLAPGNRPMGDLRVVLHRVDATGGATVAETTSGSDGGFELAAPASVDTAAVYFVAARYEGELYIGEPFRAEAAGRPMMLQVGDPANSATTLLAETEGGGVATRGRPATPASWLLILVPLLGVAGVVVWRLVPRQQVAPERALFIRVAEIDERLETAPEGQRASLLEERTRLVERLRAG